MCVYFSIIWKRFPAIDPSGLQDSITSDKSYLLEVMSQGPARLGPPADDSSFPPVAGSPRRRSTRGCRSSGSGRCHLETNADALQTGASLSRLDLQHGGFSFWGRCKTTVSCCCIFLSRPPNWWGFLLVVLVSLENHKKGVYPADSRERWASKEIGTLQLGAYVSFWFSMDL